MELYKAALLPHFECCAVLSCHSSPRIKKELEKPQREAVRIIKEMEWVLHRGQGDELHLFPEKEQLKENGGKCTE